MRRFRFKLEKLLELRSFHERRAELVLAEKAGRCAILEGRLADNAAHRARAAREMFAPGRILSDFCASELYLRRLDMERERLASELIVAETEREEARVAYVEKHREHEAIKKLRDRRQGEYYLVAEREEIKTLDDVARRPAAGFGG